MPRNDRLRMTFLSLLAWGPTGWLDELTFGAGLTLIVALVSFALGALFGSLAAAAKLSGSRALRGAADTYTTVFRGVPDLLVLYLFYFGGGAMITALARLFGYAGVISMPAFLTAVVAIGLVNGAYQTEVIRGAYLAIARGELEAARAIGMGRVTMLRRIVVPQVLRFALPGLGNVWQLCLKESALVAVIGLTVHLPAIDVFSLFTLPEVRFNDLLRQAHVAAGSTRQPFIFYLAAAGFYLVLTSLSTFAFNRAENRALAGMRRA
jgi:octopine/nopaline transport system permease protein